MENWTRIIDGEEDEADKVVEGEFDKYKTGVFTKADKEKVVNNNNNEKFRLLI